MVYIGLIDKINTKYIVDGISITVFDYEID